MAQLFEHIKTIQSKLQTLLSSYKIVTIENETQKNIIAALQAENLNQKEYIAALLQKQLILKATLDELDETEKKLLDKKINGYIKNIDKCIALLTNKPND